MNEDILQWQVSKGDLIQYTFTDNGIAFTVLCTKDFIEKLSKHPVFKEYLTILHTQP